MRYVVLAFLVLAACAQKREDWKWAAPEHLPPDHAMTVVYECLRDARVAVVGSPMPMMAMPQQPGFGAGFAQGMAMARANQPQIVTDEELFDLCMVTRGFRKEPVKK